MPTPLEIWGSSCVFYAEFGDASSVSVVDGLAAAFTDKASGITYTQPTVGSRMAYQPTGYGGGGAVLMASGKTFTFPQPANFPSGNAPHTIIIVGRYTASNAYPTPFAYGGRGGDRQFRSMSARNRRVNAGFFGDDHESAGLGWANVERMVVSMVDGASPVKSWLFNAPNSSEMKTMGGPLATPTSSTVEINRTADSFDGPVRAIIVLNRMATLDELSSGYSYFSQPYSAAGGGNGKVTPDSAAQSQAASSPTIASRTAVQPDSASQQATASSPTIAARSAVVPDSASQASTASSPAVATRSSVLPDSATQQQTTTSPPLASRGAVTPDNAAQTTQASSPALTNVRTSVVPDSATQTQAASQPSLAGAGTVAVDSATQGQTASNPTVASRSSVSPTSANQTQASTSPSLNGRQSVVVDTALQVTTLSSPTVSARATLTPNSGSQQQAASSSTVTAKAVLLVSSALQTQAATSPTLYVGQRPRPPSARTVRSVRSQRIAYSSRPPRLAA